MCVDNGDIIMYDVLLLYSVMTTQHDMQQQTLS